MNFGWHYDPAAIAQLYGSLAKPTFAQAAPQLVGDGAKSDVFFFETEQQVLGRELLAMDQDGVGSCVGNGFARNVQHLMLIEIAWEGDEEFPSDLPQDDHFVAVPAIYGASRVEIGGGQLRGGDGSNGSWAAEAIKKFGVLFCKKYGSHNLERSHFNYRLVREWGDRGIPDELEPTAREHPVTQITQMRSWENWRDAVCNGHPAPLCSDQGFTTVRDSSGFCRPQGSWAHCMASGGAGIAKGNRPFGLIHQSWGESPTGNNRLILESGRELMLPQGCFAVDADVIDRMCRQGDTWSLAGLKGFVRRRPKWYT